MGVISLLAACAPAKTPTPFVVQLDTPRPTATDTPTPESTTTPAPTETPIPPRTLTICLGAEPDQLYIHGGAMLAAAHVWQAIYDGPIDNRAFGYQPVILEKLPSLADGDALLLPVTVRAGDQVVDVEGNVQTLSAGVRVPPTGCLSRECAIEYDGQSEIQMEQLVVTFRLRPDVRWSDGEPLTAADSVYSFRLATDPHTPKAKYIEERTASYEAPDELTTQWTGLPGFRDQTYFINFWHPLPEHAWGGFPAGRLLDWDGSARVPLGWGPYVIDEWIAGWGFRLHRNPYYFRADEGLPKFDALIIRTFGEQSVTKSLEALESGSCDIIDQEASAYFEDQSGLTLELHNQGQLDAHFATGTVFEHADFSLRPAAYDDGYQLGVDRPDLFGDVHTRRAIAYCMDRQAVVDQVLFGQSLVLDSYLPPSHPLFNSGILRYPFDPGTGSALLTEVGWLDHDGDAATPRIAQGVPNVPDGTPLRFNYWTTGATQRKQATAILAQSLAQCGIQAELMYWTAGAFFADGPEGPVFGRSFDLVQFAWLTGSPPPCDLYVTEHILNEVNGFGVPTNNIGYSNPVFDSACHAALSLLPGQPGHAENHRRAQEIFARDLPSIPLYLRVKLAVTRPDFCGFILDSTENSEMWNIEEFDYGEEC